MRPTVRSLLRRVLAAGVLTIAACDDPLAPDYLRAYTDLDVGTTHACALADSGEAYCWGANERGQLGVGDTGDRNRPTLVAEGYRYRAITAGDGHTCALTVEGEAYCWGWNTHMQRGNALEWNAGPGRVATDLRFVAIDAGWQHTCAIATDATVHCWGMGRSGQLGNGTTTEASGVVQVADDIRAVAISAGGQHTCVVTTDARALCWGANDVSQLAAGVTDAVVAAPLPVVGGRSWSAIGAGATHTCAVTTAGAAYCWGSNEFGELGDRNRYFAGVAGSEVPTLTSQPVQAVAISAGAHASCMIADTGIGYCWGRGAEGQLGVGSSQLFHSVPQPLYMQPGRQMTSDRFHFTDLAASSSGFSCGLVDGAAFCWGTGRRGELGAGRVTFAPLPQRVRD